MKPVTRHQNVTDLIAYLHKLIWLAMQDEIHFGLVKDGQDDWGNSANHFAIGDETYYWATLQGFTDDDLDQLIGAIQRFGSAGANALGQKLRAYAPYPEERTGKFDEATAFLTTNPSPAQAEAVAENVSAPENSAGKVICIALSPPRDINPDEHLALLRKLIWLAANEIIFFSSYNEDKRTWDDEAHPCIMVNDTFYYACADSELLEAAQIDALMDAFAEFGGHGVNAFVALRRNIDVLKPLQSSEYVRARLALANKILPTNGS